MNERDWLRSRDPLSMLHWLCSSPGPSPRKLRLFACACVRREVCFLLMDAGSRAVVGVAERFADGEASERERALAEMDAFSQPDYEASWMHRPPSGFFAGEAAVYTVCVEAVDSAVSTAGHVLAAMSGQGLDAAGRADQADLLRDIFGPLPYRPLPHLDAAWLAANDGAPHKLAETIYRERRWEDLPILADALDEAGCTAVELLDHLRAPAPHVRGCWAVDAVLGRS